MIHLGDISKIKQAPFVDCITFGSPCQDLSIAGKRAGLSGERSGLFMEAVRIIKEMRCYSGGVYPTFAIWENVPGAFSSNSGKDFHAVLEELARIEGPEISIPRPKNGKWAKAGVVCGDGWSMAWRTFDAQFWGVLQRRRRIAVVVDFGGFRAGEILFERTGVSRNTEPRIQTWKGIARNPADSTAGHDRVVEGAGAYTMLIRGGCQGGGKGALVSAEKSGPLLEKGERAVLFAIQGNAIDRDVKQNGSGIAEGKTMFTLNATDRHGVCCAAFTAGQGARSRGIAWAAEQAPTLRTNGGLTAMPTVLCRAHRQANAEMLENCAPTLNCNHEQPIVFESHSQDARYTQQRNTFPACTAQWGTGGNNMPLVAETIDCRNNRSNGDLSGTIQAKENGGYSLNYINPVALRSLRWIVRRLTPTECERLQGFPDGWTDIGEWTDSKGKRHKPADSPRYKAIGNSIALPQWWWIICKMARYLPEHATLGSLFDGIGGFPLVWETLHGKGTAIWASEIDEFCVAVTKRRFGDD